LQASDFWEEHQDELVVHLQQLAVTLGTVSYNGIPQAIHDIPICDFLEGGELPLCQDDVRDVKCLGKRWIFDQPIRDWDILRTQVGHWAMAFIANEAAAAEAPHT
jgi:hypothetical protein